MIENYKKNTEHILDIISLSTEGKGIAKVDDNFVIFVEKAIPGDKIKARITRRKSGYAEASMLELITPSQNRIKPKCRHFGVCGGCKLQNYYYRGQIDFKKEAVKNAFERIGGFEIKEIPEPIKSYEEYFYRNKMEYSFSDDKWLEKKDEGIEKERFALGLHIPKFYSKILDIEECFLQSETSYKTLNFTRNFFKERNISVYTTKTHSGFLRFLVIRQSKNTRDFMVNIITYDFDEALMKEYTDNLLKYFPEITTIVNSITKSKAQVAFAEESVILYGKGFIYEKLFNESETDFNPDFKISPNSFFQTNTNQTAKLYSIASDFSELNKNDKVLDLYCGAGTIAIYISNNVNQVLGVELITDAISNAEENIELNNIKNVSFITSDIKDFLINNNYTEYNKVILDPPRSGLHPDICKILSESHFERITYISCNPGTQARDLKIICEKENFAIDKIQPVDMFPQTYHVENVVSLKRT